MISTSNLENNNVKMTPEERKLKVSELRKEHQEYFEHSQIPDENTKGYSALEKNNV